MPDAPPPPPESPAAGNETPADGGKVPAEGVEVPAEGVETPAEPTLAEVLDKPPPAAERPAAVKLAVFGAVLILVLFAGYGIGRLNEATPSVAEQQAAARAAGDKAVGDKAVGDKAADGMTGDGMTGDGHGHGGAPAPAPPHDETGHDGTGHDDTGTAPHVHNADGSVTPGGGGAGAGTSVGGLTVTDDGLTISPVAGTFVAGRQQTFSFVIRAAGNAPVTTFAVVHDKPLHLVVVRRDLSGFQHLHPAMAPDGTWSVPLTLAAPGSYRAVADFTAVVGGKQVATTLGVDLTVPGNYRPVPLAAPARQAVAGAFQVAYEGEPRIGSTQPLFMTVTTTGRPVRLEPYLGAYGHLVVLREGDVGYVHVHPEPELVDGKVKFWLAAPGPGRYRMYFDFQVAGAVHTAAWTAEIK